MQPLFNIEQFKKDRSASSRALHGRFETKADVGNKSVAGPIGASELELE
jgi:hypothetical protein